MLKNFISSRVSTKRLLTICITTILTFLLLSRTANPSSMEAGAGLTIKADKNTISVNEQIHFSAMLIVDGVSKPVTSAVTWNSSNRDIGTVTGQGVFTGNSGGTTGISATMGGTSDESPIKTSNTIVVTVNALTPTPPPPPPIQKPDASNAGSSVRPQASDKQPQSQSVSSSSIKPWGGIKIEKAPERDEAVTFKDKEDAEAEKKEREAKEVTPINYGGDADEDGLPDFWENFNFGNLSQGANDDYDKDRLDNWREFRANTNPKEADTDHDGLNDRQELEEYHTNPNSFDSDGDSLSDGAEANNHQTNPLNKDSDNDGFDDGVEIRAGSSPTDSSDTITDENNDGIADIWVRTNLNYIPDKEGVGPTLGTHDSDGDGISDRQEYLNGTDPNKQDSDGDGLSDAEENLYGTDPLNSKSNLKTASSLAITNIKPGERVADNAPTFTGTADPLAKIVLLLVTDEGSRKQLAIDKANEAGTFLIRPETEIVGSGNFTFTVATVEKENLVKNESAPINIELDLKSLKSDMVQEGLIVPISNFGEVDVPGDSQKTRLLEFEIGSNNPAITGRAPIGSIVFANWESLLFTSSLIADNKTGVVTLRPPSPLPDGRHKVVFYVIKDNVRGPSVTYNFLISAKARKDGGRIIGSTALVTGARSSIKQAQIMSDIFNYLLTNYWILIVTGALIILIIWVAVRHRKRHE